MCATQCVRVCINQLTLNNNAFLCMDEYVTGDVWMDAYTLCTCSTQRRWRRSRSGRLTLVRKTPHFWAIVMLKMLILPRWARDKHRQSWEKDRPLSAGCYALSKVLEVRKRHFLSTFYIKMLVLPRQARDTHRESSTQNEMRFSCRSACWSNTTYSTT